MTATFLRRIIFLVFAALPILAQEATTTTAPSTPPAPAAAVPLVNSETTRAQLIEVLNSLPPQVGKALKLDPTLWSNQAYLANYPALASFISAHPEVTHSPAYFLEEVWIPNESRPETANFRMWNQLLETISIFTGFAIFGGILMWLIRTIIDHRRWSRLTRTQAEVHNKLLDRFASNEDLLKYVSTPAGQRFLESAPIQLEGPRSISSPAGRVLWSVQVGIVLTAAGVGLKVVSFTVDQDVSQPLAAMGILGIAIGIGFIVAAAASFFLSRRLGLWQAPAMESQVSE
jgi:ABC-type Fe3+-siderophore transport system permease subunit